MLLVAGEVEVFSMLEHGYVGISYYLLFNFNASVYLLKGGRLGLMPRVLFHSCRPSSVLPVLCSLSLRSLRGWVIYGTPLTVRLV